VDAKATALAQNSNNAEKPDLKRLVRFWDNEWTTRKNDLYSTWPDVALRTSKIDTDKINTILDVGCGEQDISIYMDDKVHVIGLDISFAGLKLAKCRSNQNRISFVQAVSTDLPFKDSSFDAVVSFDTITLTGHDHLKSIEEMYRVSRDYIIFNVSHEDSHSFKTIDGIMMPLAFNEQQVSDALKGMHLKELQLEIFTINEFYNLGQPIYQRMNFQDGDKKLGILAIARK
jgi:ubiquinone/menaquinone biosynthesis C-methylase UbiE